MARHASMDQYGRISDTSDELNALPPRAVTNAFDQGGLALVDRYRFA